MSARTAETILLVDDEAMVRDLVAAMLRNYGYQVLVAENADDFVEVGRVPSAHVYHF